MSMDEAPSRSFMVMDDMLCHYGDLHERRWLDWEVVECCKRSAIGCGLADKHILDGIELCVLRGDDDHPKHYPAMSIRASDDVFFHVGMMIDDDAADIWGRDTYISCRVCAIEGEIMVIRLAFTTRHVTGSYRAYYLVCDTGDTSLTMIPAQDPRFLPMGITCPLPLRRQDGGYSLAVLASRVNHATDCPALYLWNLPAPSDISSQKDMDQWVVKDRDRLDADRFDVHVVFSCNGNALWGDLTQGIMYCSNIELLKAGGDHVNFKYVRLPGKHRIPYHEAIMMGEAHVFRNMGLVGNSIWFVAITPSESDSSTADTMVEVWTLDITQQMPKEEHREWAMHINFRMQSIWELDAFSENRLPKTLPRFPILRQEDAGILYMLLPNPNGTKGHLVGIDVGQSTSKMLQIVSSRRLEVPWMRRPVVLPHDFFKPPEIVD